MKKTITRALIAGLLLVGTPMLVAAEGAQAQSYRAEAAHRRAAVRHHVRRDRAVRRRIARHRVHRGRAIRRARAAQHGR